MRALLVLAGAIIVASIGVAAPVSLARFTSSAPSSGSVSTGTIAPPTALTALTAASVVTLSWTPTVSTAATGYDVLRSATSGSGYAVIGSATPRIAVTTTDSPGTGTFYYVLRSVLQAWRSADSNVASATVGTLTTGFKGCTTTAADTGGDGNGYESSPGNACAVDGNVALDASSGTTMALSCTDAGKDRHRFWGYAFGLPATVAAISGIQVQLDAGLNNNGGTSNLCVQLSWDGGTSWTTARQAVMGGASITSYAFGGTADTWGRSWTIAQLATSAFRVRIIDVSNQATKDFRLDGARVAVSYAP